MAMKTSSHGIALIKQFEGLHKVRRDGTVEAYLCPEKVPTIGWGCTKNVKLGDVLSVEECEARLQDDLGPYEAAINGAVTVPLNQHQFDALASFAWNVGPGWISGQGHKQATFIKQLNAGDYSAVPRGLAQFTRGAKSGKAYKGLRARREAEARLWLTPVTQAAPEPPKAAPGPVPQDVRPVETPLRKVSRKFQLLDLLKWLFGLGAAGTGGTISASNIEATKTYADQVMGVVTSYGVPGLIVLCVLGYVASQAVQNLMEQDRAKGTYTPSGEVEA